MSNNPGNNKDSRQPGNYGYPIQPMVGQPGANPNAQRMVQRQVNQGENPNMFYGDQETVPYTIEVPLVQHIETVMPVVEVREVVRSVPRIVPEYREKIVEVPVIKTVERIVEDPVIKYNVKYVPKEEIVERIITKPVVEYKTVERIVEKLTYVNEPEPEPVIETGMNPPTSLPIFPVSPKGRNESLVTINRVPIGEAIPSLIELPVPYMVPKPFVVPIEVPVLQFRDHFVPVPVRKRVVPRFKWTEEVYEVECLREQPYFVYEDIIKPVPVDVEFKRREVDMDVNLMNPSELSQADFHAMWMRVNADLLEERRQNLGEEVVDSWITPYKDAMEGVDANAEPSLSRMQSFEKQLNLQRQLWDPIPLAPGNPLMMTYLQNQWLLTVTTQTHEIYTQDFFYVQQQALFNLLTGAPQQISLAPHQIHLCGYDENAGLDTDNLPPGVQHVLQNPEDDRDYMDSLGPIDQTPLVTYPIQQCIPMSVLGAAPVNLPENVVPVLPSPVTNPE